MRRREMATSWKNVVALIAGVLLVGTLAAECAFAKDEAAQLDGRNVEITYLNDAEPDEIVAMEDTSLEGVFAAGSNDTLLSDPSISIVGVTDQSWTGEPITQPDLKVRRWLKPYWAYDDSYNFYYYFSPEDYSVKYENNINPGTARIIITGTEYNWWLNQGEREGSLTGSIVVTFKILETPEYIAQHPKESEPADGTVVPKGTSMPLGSGASKGTYTVTGADTMTFTKSKAKKSATSAVVPDTVSFLGKTYRVTAIAKKAFYGKSKLKKVTVGTNVTAIGANAFGKCGKLKTLIVKSKGLKASKCKKCLTGSSVKTVKVPAAVKKTYKKKIFVKKICGLKVTVK